MRELFFFRDNLVNKISYYHLILLMASLPFDRFYSHIILISLLAHTLIHVKREAIKSVFDIHIPILTSVLLITVCSTIYTAYPANAYAEWGKQFTILLFPLFFCLTALNIRKYRAPLLLAFSLICTLTVAYLFVDTILSIRYYGLPASALFSYAFTNHNFALPIGVHATFFSMQLAIALIYLLSLLIKETGRLYQCYELICIAILSAGLVQLGAKSVCFCLLVTLVTAVPWFLLKGSARWKFIGATIALSLLSFFFIIRLHAFQERYVHDLMLDLSKTSTGQIEDPRVARWYAAMELIAKAPLIGHGAGSEIAILRPLFFEKRFYNSYLHQLNAHNQYLSFLLKSGVLGLLTYLCTLLFGFWLSLLRKDLMFLLFMLLIASVSVSENLLDVDKGIIFYAFFFSFFVFSSPVKNEVVEV